MLKYNDVCNVVNTNQILKRAEKQAKREERLATLAGIGLAVATVILAITIFIACKAEGHAKAIPKSQVRVEKQIKQKYGKRVRFYDTKDIDEYIIVTRKDKKRVVVERATKFRKGSRIVTYLVYNPATYYIDDVIERIDIVAKK